MSTYLLDSILVNTVNSLCNLVNLVGLVAVDETSTSELDGSRGVLAVLKLLELGESLRLLELLGADTGGDLLEGLDDSCGGTTDSLSRTGDGDGEQASIGVDVALGLDLGTWVLSASLRKEGEAWRPLNGRFTTEERGKDRDLRLVETTSEGAGAWESKNHSVTGAVGDTLLTTEVLRLLALQVAGWLRANVTEELVDPFGELSVLSTVGDNGERWLSVGGRGELGNGVGVEVLAEWKGGRWVERNTKAAVESKAVGGVEGHLLNVCEELLLLHLDDSVNLLVVHVCYVVLAI